MLAALNNADFNVTAGQLLAQMKKWNLQVNSMEANDINDGKTEDSCSPTFVQPVRIIEPDDTRDAGFIGNLRLVASDPEINLNSSLEEKHDEAANNIPRPDIEDSQKVYQLSDDMNLAQLESITSPEQEANDLVEVELEPETEAIINNLNAHAESLRRQLPTIMEPWCEVFPTTCCCRALFAAENGFSTSPKLYHILLEQAPTQTLLYAIALLNLADTETKAADEPVLRDHLWSTIEYYLRICTRTEIKNSVATRILHALLHTWNKLYQDQFPLPTSNTFQRSVRSRGTLLDKLVKTKPKKDASQKQRRSRWQAKAELDIGAISGFIAKRPSTWPLINWSGGQFGSTDGWWPTDDPKNAGLIETAAALSDHMTKIWATEQKEKHPRARKLPSLEDLGACNVPLIFDTLGLMLALELSSYAADFTSNGSLLHSPKWPTELSKFIDTTVRTLSLNAEYAEKFRKTYWLISAEQIGYSGKCKSVHTGPCTAAKEWQALNRSVHDWDEPRTWIERRLFTNRNSWPQTEDLVTADNMSMRSVSSFNSFKRFQALALHLKIGTPHSRSVRTKSTKSKMSVDSHLSWQLEHMLDIKAEDPATDKGGLEPLVEMEEDVARSEIAVLVTRDFGNDSQAMATPAVVDSSCVGQQEKTDIVNV